ncbi:hypothetical protein BCON_0238g00160 [Botryotinia convoluta]|uniref:Uncharacterized protein n=1 Tax=Botryotinia convoluta TaxID=54673 RepID=A0A4Z1HIA7_9HELO|nr:hypothetical protein BCON_0238g00160 [Botryotinia convoluta]
MPTTLSTPSSLSSLGRNKGVKLLTPNLENQMFKFKAEAKPTMAALHHEPSASQASSHKSLMSNTTITYDTACDETIAERT